MRTDPYEGLKAWLHRYQELQTDAGRLFDRVDELRGRIESARTSTLDGMPHSQTRDGDKTGALLAQLEEIEGEARAAQEAAAAYRREIRAAIRQIIGPRWADRREVLRLRYLDGLRWEDVSEKLFGDEADYWDRPEAFLRRVYKIHGAALEELSKIVPLEQGQENYTEMEDMEK